MKPRPTLRTERVTCEDLRECALEVLSTTYRDEKRWVADAASQLPNADLDRDDIAWFVVFADGAPAGVVRVLYTPPLAQYRDYGLRFMHADLDVDSFLATHRIAEIGRFAVIPERRRNSTVMLALLREAIADTVRRGYTHYITDVFENEANSPLQFHTRVLGFVPVATHATGELQCDHRRITMLLDLAACYARLSSAQGYFFRLITEGWEPALHDRLAAATRTPGPIPGPGQDARRPVSDAA